MSVLGLKEDHELNPVEDRLGRMITVLSMSAGVVMFTVELSSEKTHIMSGYLYVYICAMSRARENASSS